METCFSLYLVTDNGSIMNYYFFARLGLYLKEKERARKKKKTDSKARTQRTQKQVVYTVQSSFPQRLLTFLP